MLRTQQGGVATGPGCEDVLAAVRRARSSLASLQKCLTVRGARRPSPSDGSWAAAPEDAASLGRPLLTDPSDERFGTRAPDNAA